MQETARLSGQTLIDRMITGDDTAWRTFLEDFGPLIVGLSKRSGLDDDEADDIAQSVVVKLLDRDCRVLRKLKIEGDSFYGWVKVVVSRAIYDYLRASRRRLERNQAYLTKTIDEGSHILSTTERIEVRVDIEKIVDELSGNEQTLFYLDYRDVPDSEIARILGLSLGAAQQRLSRLRKKIRQIIREMDG
mgnify:CR=1 FL=1